MAKIPDPTPRQDLLARSTWKRYEVLNKQFIVQKYWDTEPLKVIEKKFPAGINHFDPLPIGFAALEGMKYIESKVYNVVSRQDAYGALLVTVAGM